MSHKTHIMLATFFAKYYNLENFQSISIFISNYHRLVAKTYNSRISPQAKFKW